MSQACPKPEKEFHMKICRDGSWWHEGRPIRRQNMVQLFSTVLKREKDGSFWLETPAEKGRIEVEDAPFLAVEMIVAGTGRNQILKFRTNVDDVATLDADHLLRIEIDPKTQEPRPYIRVRENLEARLLRPVFYELVSLGVENPPGEIGVWSAGQFFSLGKI